MSPRKKGTPQTPEKVALPTPVRTAPLGKLLDGYFDKEYILKGFTEGFDIGFVGEHKSLLSHNSLSVNRNPKEAFNKVKSEVALDRIAGPFPSPPLKNFKCSPLALREKSTPGSYRLLHNLSFPYNSDSVNGNIPEENSKLQYASISDAIGIINNYGRCFLAKSDIAEAYRLVPVHPSCYNLLGFKINDNFYFDKCLPMGACSACKIFERFSSALKFILTNVYKVKHVVKLLDDFLFIGETEKECAYALDSFKHLCRLLNVPLAANKTMGPSTCAVFLGIQLDTEAGMASIPEEKVSAYASAIKDKLGQDQCTLTELKSLLGKLQFTCCVITTGRCFLRRLYDKTIGLTKGKASIRLDEESKLDLNVWESFLSMYNGRTLLSFTHSQSSSELHMYSDSSKEGYGATFQGKYLLGEFPPSWSLLDIQVLELYPIFLLVNIFGPCLKNQSITFHCDNSAIVHTINKQSCRNKIVMKLLRPMVLLMLQLNIKFRAVHIPGLKNDLCDALSRKQVPRLLLRKYGMASEPVSVPLHLRPHNFKLL